MSVKDAIHSKVPFNKPVSKPLWARLTKCTHDMLVANSAKPIMGHLRLLPAKKYSLATLVFLFALRCLSPVHKPIASMAQTYKILTVASKEPIIYAM